FVGPFDQSTGPESVADFDLGHLSDKDGDAILRANDYMLDVGHVFDEPEPTDHRPGATGLDDITPNITVTPHDCVHDRRERDAEGAQAVRIHINLVLAYSSPDTGHFGDAGHGVELITDEPVLE